MNLLLDTHTVLWYWWDDPRLSVTASSLISDPANRKLVSLATPWEVAIKVSLKKLDLGGPYLDFFPQQMSHNHFEWLSIGDGDFSALACLPFYHKDPFDRLIIAQAMTGMLPIISSDAAFDAYSIQRIW